MFVVVVVVKIFNLMRYDSYSRFLKSQMYKDCIVNEMEGKPLVPNELHVKSSSKNLIQNGFSSLSRELNTKNKKSLIIGQLNSNPANSQEPTDSSPSNAINGKNFNFNFNEHNLNIGVTSQSSTNASTPSSPTTKSMITGYSSNLTNIPANSASVLSSGEQSPNKKDKKKSTILPWTKGRTYTALFSLIFLNI